MTLTMECVSLNAERVGPEGLGRRRASGLRMAQAGALEGLWMARAGALEGLGPWDGSGLGRLRALVWLRLGWQRASGLGMTRAGTIEGLRMAWTGMAEGLRMAWAGMVEGLGPRDGSGWGGGRASGWLGLGKGGAGAGDCVGFSLGLHCWHLVLDISSASSGSGASLRDLSWGWSGG